MHGLHHFGDLEEKSASLNMKFEKNTLPVSRLIHFSQCSEPWLQKYQLAGINLKVTVIVMLLTRSSNPAGHQ